MKFRYQLPFSLFMALAIFMSSCRAPKELVYKDFKNFSIDKMGFAASTIKMDIIYYNPNNFGLQLKRTDLDIYIDDKFLGHTAQEFQISIPKRGDFSIPLNVQVDMKNILKNAIGSLLGQEVTVKVTGTVKVGKMNVYKTFPVNYEGRHSLPVL